MLIIDMPKKYLTDASGFVSCAMCQKHLPILCRDCHKDFKGCLIKGELPDEHGDLVDKETAKNAFDSSFLTFRMKDGETMRGFYQRSIDELPVLIAAERKDGARNENH